MLVLFVLALSLASGWYFGLMAFSKGMGAKRWACMGVTLGPAAYPLFCAHLRLVERKIGFYGRHSIGL